MQTRISHFAMLFLVAFSVFQYGCKSSTTQNPAEYAISLNKTEMTLMVGDTETLVATVTPPSSAPLVWMSSNETAATVFYGIVTAKEIGTTTITAMCDTLKVECTVNIIAKIDTTDGEIVDRVGDYALVWSDEFTGTTLNTNLWNVEVNGDGGGNNELQFYRAENVSVGNEPASNAGCLILTAKKENYSNKTATSGRITTKNKVTFSHGMIEARVKMPFTANGLWPAFWLMGNDYDQVGWPSCGEIDILEMGHQTGIARGTQDRYYNGACHWGTSWNGGSYPNYANASTNSYSMQGDFHTFRLYWDDTKFAMYLDQDLYPNVQPYYELTISDSSSDTSPGTYFHKPVFILFNLAVGGNFPGIWNIDQVTALNNGPQAMYVDHVRVYQKGASNETFWKR